jgi:hypothetical protein
VCTKVKPKRDAADMKIQELSRIMHDEALLLHSRYTLSFYWSGNAVEQWRAKFKEMIEEKVEVQKQKISATKELIAKRKAEIKASLDADDHEKRYAEAKDARAQLEAEERAEMLADYKASKRAEKHQAEMAAFRLANPPPLNVKQEKERLARVERLRKKLEEEEPLKLIETHYKNFQHRYPQEASAGSSSQSRHSSGSSSPP